MKLWKAKRQIGEATVSASSRRESVFKIDSPNEKQSKTANLGNLGNCKLKEWDTTIHLLGLLKSKKSWHYQKLTRKQKSRRSLSFIPKGTKHSLTMWCAPRYLPKWIENFMSKRTCTQRFIEALLIIAKNKDNSYILQWMDG